MSSDTANSVHGHQILHLVLNARPAMTRDQLTARVTRLYGPGAQFHTCSVSCLSLDQLVNFLLSRGKLVERDHLLFTDTSKMCGDGEHAHH